MSDAIKKITDDELVNVVGGTGPYGPMRPPMFAKGQRLYRFGDPVMILEIRYDSDVERYMYKVLILGCEAECREEDLSLIP